MATTVVPNQNEDVRQPWAAAANLPNPSAPHSQCPVDRHCECIDRVDLGNSITNQAMDRIENIFNSDRVASTEQNEFITLQSNLLNLAISFLSLPGVAQDNQEHI